MKNQEGDQRESAVRQVPTVAPAVDSEKKPDNTATLDIPLSEKAETQSKGYQRSRNVALMKLALLRGEQSQAE
jgi:hypothetical protein